MCLDSEHAISMEAVGRRFRHHKELQYQRKISRVETGEVAMTYRCSVSYYHTPLCPLAVCVGDRSPEVGLEPTHTTANWEVCSHRLLRPRLS